MEMATETTAIEPIAQEVLTLADQVRGICVVDQETFDGASDLLNSVVKRLRKQIAEHHDPLIKSAYDNWKLNIAAKKKLDDPLDEAEKLLKGKIAGYMQEQEAARLKLQRENEAQAQKEAEEKRLADATALEASGADKAAVDAELAKPVVAERVAPVAPTFEKRSDVVTVKTYSAEVTHFEHLVKAAAKNPALMGYLEVNQPALNAAARSMKETMSIPGVKLVVKSDVRGKAR